MRNAESFKDYLPDSIENIIHTEIDLDITNLTLADVMRHINHIYPKNTIAREKMANGSLAIAVLCKSEYLDPLKGVLLLFVGDDVEIDVSSKKYAVIIISEQNIINEHRIMDVNDNLAVYLAKNYKNAVDDFNMFYNRFLYNAYEANR